MNGLILLLADLGVQAKHRSDGNFKQLVRDKVKQYIEQYILSDKWSVKTIKGNTLAANWKNRCYNEYLDEVGKRICLKAV